MFRCLRFQVRPDNTQPVCIGIKFLNKTIGKIFGTHPLFIGPLDYLIINIGEIPDECHLETTIAKVTDNHVKDQKGTGMADMAIIIRGDPTHIQLYMPLFNGLEGLFFSRQRIINSYRHGFILINIFLFSYGNA